MKKKNLVTSSIILAVGLIAIVFVSFILPGLVAGSSNDPTPGPTPSPTPGPTSSLILSPEPTVMSPPKMKLELEFEDAADLKWLQLFNKDGTLAEDTNAALVDGVIHLGKGNPFTFFNVMYEIAPNQFVHFRTRSGERTCGSVGLEKGLPDQNKAIHLEYCTDSIQDALAVFNRDHFGDSIFADLPRSGSVRGFTDEWIDKIIWINENGDQIFYLITNTADPAQVMYGSVALPEDWLYDRWGFGVGGYFDAGENAEEYIDVDFIRVGSGTLKSYLTESVPAYLENQEELDAFLEMPAAPMPDLLPPQQQGQNPSQEENVIETQAKAETEMEMEAGGQVLTWPDPEAILPYLVTLEELERCDNCAYTVRGVELSPLGYVFSTSFGFPPDGGPLPRGSFIRQWVQIFTNPIDKEELIKYYKLYSRIQPYEAGEPIQFIYNWGGIESNLMLNKANILTIASVGSAGKNLRIGSQIVKDTLALIPEEGLITPEMVAEPPTDLNEEAAAKFLDAAWVGTFEEPATPVYSFDYRTNVWLRLKAPADVVEMAIYHPDSQTYLSYFWIENPPVGSDFAMTGLVSTRDTQSPNQYYLGNYQGPMLVRVWVDGQLVSEFAIEG